MDTMEDTVAWVVRAVAIEFPLWFLSIEELIKYPSYIIVLQQVVQLFDVHGFSW